MHFIKIGESYINLDNVTSIQKQSEGLSLGYVIGFIGRSECCTVSETDMSDIRRELEKIKKLQDLDQIVLKIDKEANSEKDKEIRKINAAPNWCKRQFQKQVEETGKLCEPIQRALEDK